jgi:hypothetical protein
MYGGTTIYILQLEHCHFSLFNTEWLNVCIVKAKGIVYYGE